MENGNNEILFIITVAVVIITLMVIAVIDLLLLNRNRKLKHTNQILELEANFQQEVMKTRIEVTQETLNEISLELHDNLGQMLTLTMMQLQNGVKGDVVESLQNSINELRSISRTISKDFGQNLLTNTIHRFFERINRSGSLMANAVFPPDGIVLESKERELFLLRIIQELINNSLKHSRAGKLILDVKEESTYYIIKYQDNGIGFSLEDLSNNGLGLASIENRCKFLNAECQINTKPNQGFIFEIKLPK